MKNKVIVNGIDVLEYIEYKENLIKDLKNVVLKQYKLLELYKEALETNFEGITLIKLVNKTLRIQIKELENE